MSDNNPQQPQKQVLNLQTISQNFLVGMQRQFDLLAYNLASRNGGSNERYDQICKRPRLMPLPQAHMNFEQVEAFSQDLLLRNFLNDLLKTAAACLDNCFLLTHLISRKQELEENQEATQKSVQEAQQKFAQSPLHEKFDQFEKKFGFISEYEDTLISTGFCIQCILFKKGIVSEAEAEDGSLVLEFKKLKADAVPGVPAEDQLETIEKSFKVGDQVQFSDEDLQLLLLTVSAFFNQMFKFIQEFSQQQTSEG